MHFPTVTFVLTTLAAILPSATANYNIYQYACNRLDSGGNVFQWDFVGAVPHKGLPCKNYFEISGTYMAKLDKGDSVAMCRQVATFHGTTGSQARLMVTSNISPSYTCWNARGTEAVQMCTLPGFMGSCMYQRLFGCTTDVCSGDWQP